MSDNPWSGLEAIPGEHQFSGRRVDATIPWSFFWARDHSGNLLLTMRHKQLNSPAEELPRFRGIEISLTRVGQGEEALLVIKLTDAINRELFYKLCLDIIAATSVANTEKIAVEIAVRRTWRWHYMLRTGRDGRLSPEEQKGLIGELLFMEAFLLPNLKAIDALSAWTGPSGSPKDFELGRMAVEIKARRGTARPQVSISSADQLDSSGVDSLFLHIVDLSRSPSDGGGISVDQYAQRVADLITPEGPIAVDLFEELLLTAGLRPEDSYQDQLWIEGGARSYRVTELFPRIIPTDLKVGVVTVSYALDITLITQFEVDEVELHKSIEDCTNA